MKFLDWVAVMLSYTYLLISYLRDNVESGKNRFAIVEWIAHEDWSEDGEGGEGRPAHEQVDTPATQQQVNSDGHTKNSGEGPA